MPYVWNMFLEDLSEAFRQGTRRFALDIKNIAYSWGFQLKNIFQ